MKKFSLRVLGASIVLVCGWWAVTAAEDFSLVSPIHWGLMVPYVSLNMVPALVGTLTGTLLLLRGRAGKTLLLAFALTAAQATTVTVLSPDIRATYDNAVDRSLDTLNWSRPLLEEE